MKRTLKANMVLMIWGFTAILFSIILYVNFVYDRDQELENLRKYAHVSTENYVNMSEEIFSRAAAIPLMTALRMETSPDESADDLTNYMRGVVERNPEIYGAAIAFEPFGFDSSVEHFAPYCYRSDGQIKLGQLGNGHYDYLQKDWYRVPKTTMKPGWSEPYFDEGGGNILMTTYSQPFFDKERKLRGIATVDICLKNLTDEMEKMKLGGTGYVFIVSGKGSFVSFPDRSKILKGNLYEIDPELADQLFAGKMGFVRARDPRNGEPALITFSPISEADFKVAVVYPEREILQGIYGLQQNSLLIGISGLILLLLVVILVSNSITRPVLALVESVKRVSGGDLEHKISVDTGTVEVRTLEIAFNKMISDLKEYIENLNRAHKSKEKLFVSSLTALANAVEARDQYTRGHLERVTEYSVKIAEYLGLERDEVEKIRYAALLHDVGKIKIRENVLNKAGRLTEEEFDIMKQHPKHGADIMEPVEEFRDMIPYMYHHHERYDKKGYPEGIGGEDIPLAARILAVADTFDAMTSDRPYRKALSPDIAISELEKNAGTQFDPKLAELFIKIINTEKEWLDKVMKKDYFRLAPEEERES